MRKQFWAKPGLVCFRRIASLCVEGVGAVGLQLGVGSVNQRGPRTLQQGYPASNPGRRRRLSQGDSALPRPTKDNQCSSWVALGVVSLVVGIRGFPGRSHRRSDCAFPKGCTQSGLPTGQRRGPLVPASPQCMQSRSQEAPGPAPRAGGRFVTGRHPHQMLRFAPPPSGWACIRIWRWAQRAAQSGIAAAIWRRFRGSQSALGAQVRWRPPPGPRPCSSGPARTSHSPSLLLRNGEPLSPARPGPARRQGRGLFVVPGSPSHSGARSRGETAPPQSPPSAVVVSLFSECKTARLSASRHQFKVGPSGAEQLSVRHARLRGHAPS
ncbi:hypothetical protein NDU88_002870 [Pleurodeles waltl]|uniref:Uncharacterized protein n=1 Tax=Pleurodeles waltl TaxID=8319 RepID=A0AAV7UYY4_PLEWA|nr:hypothetical protein NDU88_002870 [Pleurodeles waltl]